MVRILLASLSALVLWSTVEPPEAEAQRRRGVVRRAPVRTRIVVHRGHPIRRVLPTTVVVRPARRTVVVRAPLVFRPAVVWTAAVVALPPRERLIWEDSETMAQGEEWVDTNFGIDHRGTALLLEVDGRAQLSFAEITFDNGEVQVVDFDDKIRDRGLYELLDFKDGRRVMTVRLLAKSESPETTLRMYLRT